jgi:hypothetical protein
MSLSPGGDEELLFATPADVNASLQAFGVLVAAADRISNAVP